MTPWHSFQKHLIQKQVLKNRSLQENYKFTKIWIWKDRTKYKVLHISYLLNLFSNKKLDFKVVSKSRFSGKKQVIRSAQ